MTLSEELKWRGFLHQTTYKDPSSIDDEPISFYWGVDPSAPSMQIGNLATAMMIRHFIAHGHHAFLLVGGATGMIGDPDGKSEERNLKSLDEIATNKAAIGEQYKQLFAGQDFTIVDNYDWFKDMGYLEFLRDVGKRVPVRQMLARDFVETRLANDGNGISYAEFSYVLIQGYDFVCLNRDHGVTLQLCGSDQWGNSIAGVDLIRRINGQEAHVWSAPLIVDKSTGKKFGKSEGGAIWLDPALTSVYKFYQFWLNVEDEQVEDFLKIYTLLDRPAIEKIITEFATDRSSRLAQKRLAEEVTTLVHGSERAAVVKHVTEVLFSDDYHDLAEADMTILAQEFSPIEYQSNWSIEGALVESSLTGSLSQSRRALAEGSVYLNGQRLPADKLTLTPADALHGYAILRRGKNTQALFKIS